MKIYIILAFVALTSATEWKLKTQEEWKHIDEECKEHHKISEELTEKVRTEKYLPKEAFELGLCIMRGAGVWSDSEGFSVDRLMIALEKVKTEESINKESLRDSIKSCIDNNSEGSTPVDWAHRCYKCFRDNEQLYQTLRKVRFYEKPKDSAENV